MAAAIAVALTAVWAGRPALHWTDRRPIGALFLASYAHRSPVNPRGWLHNRSLDIVSAGGPGRFRQALLAYASRALPVLKAVNAQGVIVWDLEGEEFPQKTSYIGDPRLVEKLAPEMAPVMDEFFQQFRQAGLRVGVAVRPQQLVIDGPGQVRQQRVWAPGELLRQKIDYARQRWGATLFYIDSNSGVLWPGELLSLSLLARDRPGVLLIPEHHQPLYYAFSAPYGAFRDGNLATSSLLRILYPNAFQVLSVSDASWRRDIIGEAYRNRDVLLFPAGTWSKEGEAVKLAAQ